MFSSNIYIYLYCHNMYYTIILDVEWQYEKNITIWLYELLKIPWFFGYFLLTKTVAIIKSPDLGYFTDWRCLKLLK